MYYRLHNHCRLVRGALRGALYDLVTGKVYSVNQGAVELLTACQSQPIGALMDLTAPDVRQFTDFLDKLAAKNLGSFYMNEPPENGQQPADQSQPAGPPAPTLQFLWLEITSRCNNRCLHCYAGSGPDENTDCVPHDRWLELIGEARRCGAASIQLIGGEPLLYPRWRELVIRAAEEKYDFIEIFTNGTLIDDACIDFFKQYDVHIATTLYADNTAVHDAVTTQPGSFANTLSAVKKLLAAGVPLRIASIIMKTNETQAENIMQLCRDLGIDAEPPDVIRPTGRGNDADLQPTKYAKPPLRPPFYTSAAAFTGAHYCNTCLAGKIAITADGEVIPCIFARNQACGSILTTPLADVLNGQALQQCWHTTLDQVEKCRDCEYRYACSDCRPLAQGSDPAKRWLAPAAGCSYNPYTGKWEESKHG